ncbi:hypothetical protein ACFX5K_05465 [Rickettsiales bacterium LUAb2]
MFTQTISILLYSIVTFLVLMKITTIWYRKAKGLNDAGLVLKDNGLIIALNLAGSYVSAITVLGIPGFSNQYGLSWIWTVLIQSSVGYTPLLLLGGRLVELAKKCNAQHIIDVIKYKYKSDLIVLFSSIIIVLFVFSMLVAQMIGIRALMSVVDGNSGNTGLLWFAILIIIYFLLVGFRSVDIFYTFEGAIVIVLSFLLVFILIHAGGGLEHIKQQIWNMDPHYFSPTGAHSQLTMMYIASYWLCIGFGMIGVPYISFRPVLYSGHLKAALIGCTIIMTIILFNMNFAGFLSIPLIKGVTDSDKVIPLVIVQYISPSIGWLFLTIIVLSSISTINLQLGLIKIALTIILKKTYKLNDNKLQIPSKIITVVVVSLMFIFAVNATGSLVQISLYAIGGLASSFMWLIIFMPFNFRFVNKSAAFFSMIIGLIFYVLMYNLHLNWREVFYPVTLPVIFTLFVYVFVGYCHYFTVKFFSMLK